MGNPTAFMEIPRETPPTRPVEERLHDWNEVYREFPEPKRRQQASRCMDCGIPFCNQGCPLGNLIPDWNELVTRGHWRQAIEALHRTNNFPEFTGKVCPAPCEAACVLGINEPPVAIKLSEIGIIERAYAEGWVQPRPPRRRTGKKVAVVGSGPAGLACADQLNKAGHTVVVFERAPRPGGLLTFGIPDFKLEKHVVDRRLDLMRAEGVQFRCSVAIGKDVSADDLCSEFDAIALCMGATAPRDLKTPGRELDGILFAMDYLGPQNHVNYGDLPAGVRHVDARDKHVVIIGGGDTGADCYGTALRQGAKSVTQFEFLPKPPPQRADYNPWPEWPMIFRTSSAHEEGGTRDWAIDTRAFLDDGAGRVRALRAVRLDWTDGPPAQRKFTEVPNSEFELPADLVLLAIGYAGPEKRGPVEELGLTLDPRGNIATDAQYMTSMPGVFAAGDARRGQSLVVWAIAEGRKAARGVDLYLMGSSDLPG
ncbi:MAG: glutamate synthase subunit beta [Candidatus Sumerlaeia bacterium]|nr:glutamate synthase subunit beta [Candidatus Sumerlaeia bacterium]